MWDVLDHRHIKRGKLDDDGLNVVSLQDDWPERKKSVLKMLVAIPMMDFQSDGWLLALTYSPDF